MISLLVMWQTMLVPPMRIPEINLARELIESGKERYITIQRQTGIDWRIVGTLHYMEGGCDFKRQLFNGDFINRVTRTVPAGYGPWRHWEASALEFFEQSSFELNDNLVDTLKKMEAHNGLGYRALDINSPYLWSFTNHYDKGKFTTDGNYNPSTVSQQVGAAVLLKILNYSTPVQLELPL